MEKAGELSLSLPKGQDPGSLRESQQCVPQGQPGQQHASGCNIAELRLVCSAWGWGLGPVLQSQEHPALAWSEAYGWVSAAT